MYASFEYTFYCISPTDCHEFTIGLVEQINNFQTLYLGDLPAPAPSNDSFLTIDGEYFYHTQNPRRPEVRLATFESTSIHPAYWTYRIFFVLLAIAV